MKQPQWFSFGKVDRTVLRKPADIQFEGAAALRLPLLILDFGTANIPALPSVIAISRATSEPGPCPIENQLQPSCQSSYSAS